MEYALVIGLCLFVVVVALAGRVTEGVVRSLEESRGESTDERTDESETETDESELDN